MYTLPRPLKTIWTFLMKFSHVKREKVLNMTLRDSPWLVANTWSNHQRCSVKKVFLEISQNSEENICARVSFLIKQLYQKRDSGTGVFLWILRNFYEHLLATICTHPTTNYVYKEVYQWRVKLLSANPTKWSNTLKQFVCHLPTNCLNVFDHFLGLALKGLITLK